MYLFSFHSTLDTLFLYMGLVTILTYIVLIFFIYLCMFFTLLPF